MMTHLLGYGGALWGVAGVAGLLGYAVVRLTPLAIEALTYPLRWYHWIALVAQVVVMAYAEGYRGFQKGFAPRIAARARYLVQHPCWLHALLGPLFCMGFVYASRSRRLRVMALSVFIGLVILLVTRLAQPWRGILDAGVVVGLSWGCVSVCVSSLQALTSDEFDADAEVPEETARVTAAPSQGQDRKTRSYRAGKPAAP